MSLWNTRSTEGERTIPSTDAPIRPAPDPERSTGGTASTGGTTSAGGTAIDRQGIEDWLVAEIASGQGIHPDQVDIGESFIANGLDSAASIALVGDLGGMLGVTLAETLLWEYPSIVALAEHLAGVDQNSHGYRLPSGG